MPFENEKCSIHNDKRALSFCYSCNAFFCEDCLFEADEHYYCFKPDCSRAGMHAAVIAGKRLTGEEDNIAGGTARASRFPLKSLVLVCTTLAALIFTVWHGIEMAIESLSESTATATVIQAYLSERPNQRIPEIVDYEFYLKGLKYLGRYESPKDGIAVGDQLSVRYKVKSPFTNAVNDDEYERRRRDFAIFLTLVIVGSVVVFATQTPTLRAHYAVHGIPTLTRWVRAILALPSVVKSAATSKTAKRNAGAIILGGSIVLAAIIYACATRYVHVGSGRTLDKWTGSIKSRR